MEQMIFVKQIRLKPLKQANLPFPGLAECGADSLAPFISLPARSSIYIPPLILMRSGKFYLDLVKQDFPAKIC